MLPGTQNLTSTEDGADSGLRLLCSQALHSTERMSWPSLSQPLNNLNQQASSLRRQESGLLGSAASSQDVPGICQRVCCHRFFVCLLVVARHSWCDLESAGNDSEAQRCFRTMKTTLAEKHLHVPSRAPLGERFRVLL